MSTSGKPTAIVLDSDVLSRGTMQQTLTWAGVSVVGAGGFGVESDALVRSVRPDLVLLCLEPPVDRGLHTLRAIAAADTGTRIIAYATAPDGVLVRQAMLAGAADILSTRASGAEVQGAIATLLGRKESAAATDVEGYGGTELRGTVFTIFGPKGGCGKTTIATNLAAALAQKRTLKVALVDLSVRFGDIALSFDSPVQRTIADAARDIDKLDFTSIGNYLMRHPSGVALLPSTQSPQDWNAVQPDHIQRIIALLAQTHDYVVLDAPQAYTYTVAAALDMATIALLVTSFDLTSIKSTYSVISLLRERGFPLPKIRLITNHISKSKSASEEDIGRTFGLPVAWTVPYDQDLYKSAQQGQPVVLARPKSRAATGLMRLTAILADEAASRGRQGALATPGAASRVPGPISAGSAA